MGLVAVVDADLLVKANRGEATGWLKIERDEGLDLVDLNPRGRTSADAAATEAVPAVDLKLLHAKIGELTLEKDFLSGALSKAGLLSARR